MTEEIASAAAGNMATLTRRAFVASVFGATMTGVRTAALAARCLDPVNPASEKRDSPGLHYYYPLTTPTIPLRKETDICIYGATLAGIGAAIQARRMGKSVVLLAFDGHVGGVTSSGLGLTDLGNRAAIGGLAREFYRRLGRQYGKTEAWRFEPSVAEATLRALLGEASVPLQFEQRLTAVEKKDGRISLIETEGGHVFRASYFIDASYEGDLMARSGVDYAVGRESNATYGETLNGVHFGDPHHNFETRVDPFVRRGDPGSGLVKGLQAAGNEQNGVGDKSVQAYCFRLCLTRAANRLPFPKPPGYDSTRYELLARYIEARSGDMDALRLSARIPGGKSDTNTSGGFSSDNIGRNYNWPDGDYAERERIFQDHVTYQQGLMWFLCNDTRVPASVRSDVRQTGLPADEFRGTGGWPHQLYIREARRMIGALVMSEQYCRGERRVSDSIGLAAYQMDSHNCRRVARREHGVWTARNEGNVEVRPDAPFGISYSAITPRADECENLLVPVCVSASHIAFGAIRMEPAFFVLGQSAATAACLAIDEGKTPVQKVNIGALQARLRRDGQVLEWDAAKMPATRKMNDP